jgi:hypothetical protein
MMNALNIIPQTAAVSTTPPTKRTNGSPLTSPLMKEGLEGNVVPFINRQYVQRCLFNWRHQLGVDLSVEEHAEFRENKKSYLGIGELSPHLVCKMVRHFFPEFQFPSNPILIPPKKE